MTSMTAHQPHQHPLLVAKSAFALLHRPPLGGSKISGIPRYLTKPDGKSREDLFLDWASSTSSSIHIAPSTYGGSGLFASKPAKAGDVLFVVPSSRCIALPSATSDEGFGEAFMHLADNGGPGGRKAALAGFVAKELLLNKFSNTPSEWGSYLNLLPWQTDVQDHFLWWSDEDIEDLLFESNCCDEVISFRTGIEYACEILEGIIRVDELPWVTLKSPISDGDISEAIMGAFVCIYSRAFEDEAENCTKLIPLLDMAQHSNDPNINHESDRDGNVIVTALRELSQGEELSNTYLDVDDEDDVSKFPIYYGFLPGESKSLRELVDERNPVMFQS